MKCCIPKCILLIIVSIGLHSPLDHKSVDSINLPFSISIFLLQKAKIDFRCVIITQVGLYSSFLIPSRILSSVGSSSDDVASSRINKGDLRRIALAIAILCACPSESRWPRSHHYCIESQR